MEFFITAIAEIIAAIVDALSSNKNEQNTTKDKNTDTNTTNI
ncbi:MAG: hypothetical protein Q4D80_01545 [Pseudomonadota bacterium]|nr:hypothetical protein [Pseudomonadota bacterium]